MYNEANIDLMTKSRIHYYDEENDFIYRITNGSSVLLKINMKKNEVDSYFCLPKIKNDSGYDYIDICKSDGNIYIARYDGKGVIVLNEKLEKVSDIELDISDGAIDKSRVTRNICIFNNTIFMITAKNIYIYDMNENSLKKIYEGENTTDFCYESVVINNNIYIPMMNNNKIIIVDTNSMKASELCLKYENIRHFNSITTFNNRLYFVAQNGLIVSSNIELEDIVLVADIKEEIHRVFVIDEKLIYAVEMFNHVVWKVQEKILDKVEISDCRVGKKYEKATKFEMLFVREKSIYLQVRANGIIYSFDGQDAIKENNRVCIDEKLRVLITESLIQDNTYLVENEPIDLNTYLESLSHA